MNKIFFTLLIVTFFGYPAYPQVQNSAKNSGSSGVAYYAEKMAAVKSCEELNEQLSKMFGKEYTVADARVLAQLEKNIADKTASRCIRKKSLYGVYGEDYIHKLHLINDVNQFQNNKK